jgi:hypothetical protein
MVLNVFSLLKLQPLERKKRRGRKKSCDPEEEDAGDGGRSEAAFYRKEPFSGAYTGFFSGAGL